MLTKIRFCRIKYLLVLLSVLCLFVTSEAQTNCNIPITQSGCNYISNNNFTPTTAYNPLLRQHFSNPFGSNLIPDWNASHGSPQITDGIYDFENQIWLIPPSTPPIPATGFAFFVSYPDPYFPYNEGIVQKIPALTTSTNYLVSFFAKLPVWMSQQTLQSFKIVLLHCEDAINFTYPGATIPNLTFHHQTIVCQNNVTGNWQQFLTSFTADEDFDLIWIYPENIYSQDATTIGVSFAYPELIDVSNFSAGSPPNPTPGNCTVTIGPKSPNCGVANATYTWYGPNGLIRTDAINQQIVVDASNNINVGTWTLRMTIPNTVTPNGGCSVEPNIFATVDVPTCGQPVWPKVYIAADGLLWLKKTTGNSIITGANIINMPNNINHIGAVNTSSQEIWNHIHYGISTGITKWTNFASTPYSPFSLSNGQLQYCHYPETPFYVDEQIGNLVSGPSILPINCGQIVAEDNGVYVTYEGNRLRTYTSTGASDVSFPFSTDGYYYKSVKAYFNPISKKVFFIFNGYTSGGSSLTYLIIYSLNNGVLNQLYNTYYDLSNYKILGVNTIDELFVLNSGGTLQEFEYVTNTFTTLSIQNFNNQSLVTMNCAEQIVGDNLLLKKANDFDLYAINTINSTASSCYNSYVGLSSNGGVTSYFFDNGGQQVFVSGVFNTNNYTIANQTLPNISVGAYFQQSTFLTKLDLTSDFTALKIRSLNEAVLEPLYVQKSIAKIRSESDEKIELSLSQNPVKDILRMNVSGLNKLSSPLSGYIINTDGKKILSMSILKENNTFSVALLKPGIYYFSLFSKERVIATKLFLKE